MSLRAGQFGGGKGLRFCGVKALTAGPVPRAAWFVIIPSPRSFGSPLPFRFFQRMVAGGRVVENKSRAGAEEVHSEPDSRAGHWSYGVPWVKLGSRKLCLNSGGI